MLSNFSGFLLSADGGVVFFSKLMLSKKYFRNTIRVSNCLDPDLAHHFVGPDLDPNCLQRLADDTSRQIVNNYVIISYRRCVMLVVPKMSLTSTALHLCMRQPLKVRHKAILF